MILFSLLLLCSLHYHALRAAVFVSYNLLVVILQLVNTPTQNSIKMYKHFFSFAVLLFITVTTALQLHNTTQPSQPLPIQSWTDKTIVFVSAHPDDIEACGKEVNIQLCREHYY